MYIQVICYLLRQSLKHIRCGCYIINLSFVIFFLTLVRSRCLTWFLQVWAAGSVSGLVLHNSEVVRYRTREDKKRNSCSWFGPGEARNASQLLSVLINRFLSHYVSLCDWTLRNSLRIRQLYCCSRMTSPGIPGCKINRQKNRCCNFLQNKTSVLAQLHSCSCSKAIMTQQCVNKVSSQCIIMITKATIKNNFILNAILHH